MKYTDFVNLVEHRTSKMRVIQRAIRKASFFDVYANVDDKESLKVCVLEADAETFKRLLVKAIVVDLENLSLKALRKLGSDMRIKNYSQMARNELVGAIHAETIEESHACAAIEIIDRPKKA